MFLITFSRKKVREERTIKREEAINMVGLYDDKISLSKSMGGQSRRFQECFIFFPLGSSIFLLFWYS